MVMGASLPLRDTGLGMRRWSWIRLVLGVLVAGIILSQGGQGGFQRDVEAAATNGTTSLYTRPTRITFLGNGPGLNLTYLNSPNLFYFTVRYLRLCDATSDGSGGGKTNGNDTSPTTTPTPSPPSYTHCISLEKANWKTRFWNTTADIAHNPNDVELMANNEDDSSSSSTGSSSGSGSLPSSKQLVQRAKFEATLSNKATIEIEYALFSNWTATSYFNSDTTQSAPRGSLSTTIKIGGWPFPPDTNSTHQELALTIYGKALHDATTLYYFHSADTKVQGVSMKSTFIGLSLYFGTLIHSDDSFLTARMGSYRIIDLSPLEMESTVLIPRFDGFVEAGAWAQPLEPSQIPRKPFNMTSVWIGIGAACMLIPLIGVVIWVRKHYEQMEAEGSGGGSSINSTSAEFTSTFKAVRTPATSSGSDVSSSTDSKVEIEMELMAPVEHHTDEESA